VEEHFLFGSLQLADALDVFQPEARLELLDGEIIEMSPQKSLHATDVSLIEDTLRDGFGTGFHIRGQKPFILDDYSESEPDVAVVIRDYTDDSTRPPPMPAMLSQNTGS